MTNDFTAKAEELARKISLGACGCGPSTWKEPTCKVHRNIASALEKVRLEALEECRGIMFDGANRYQQMKYAETDSLKAVVWEALEKRCALFGDEIEALKGERREER